MRLKAFSASLLALVAASHAIVGPALAWGDSGHRMISEAAMRALPRGLPAFLYSAASITDVGQYSREPDVWRKAGTVHDAERDPAHMIKLNDDGTTLGGDSLDHLPATRSLYDASLRAKGADPVDTGFLPYSLVDMYQQVAKDFAFLRVIAYAISQEEGAHKTDKTKLAWLKGAQRRREDLTLRDIGILAHYAGDSAQPMHLSIHYNGWGDHPNPEGFTTAPIHWPVEGAFVRDNISPAAVTAAMSPLTVCSDKVELCVAHRLQRHFTQVVPLYQLEKDGGFKPGDPRGATYLAARMAEGASDLRDMINEAWLASTTVAINFVPLTYQDVEAGKVKDLYALLYGDS